MQTFLPYADFTASIKCLDKKRAFKQCVEASQIIATLENRSSGWKNHPAVLMWKGYVPALKEYYNICWMESVTTHKVKVKKLQPMLITDKIEYPPWLGNERFHASHRSNLLRKDYAHYSQFGWTEPDCLEYVWPTKVLV